MTYVYSAASCFNNGKNKIIDNSSKAPFPSYKKSDVLDDNFENNEILLCETFISNIDEKIILVDVGNKPCIVTIDKSAT